MSGNPYQPPAVEVSRGQTAERQEAIRAFHLSVALLAVPATFNLICFNFPLSINRRQVILSGDDQLSNLVAFALLIAVVWLFGFLLLEKAANVLHRLLGKHSSARIWRQTLYTTLKRAPLLAMLGALLWITWTIAFYQLGLNFFLISLPIGVMAHLLAALLYVPLFWRWFFLEREARRVAPDNSIHAELTSSRDSDRTEDLGD